MKYAQSRSYQVLDRSYESTRSKRLRISEEMEGMVTSMLTHFYRNPEYATAREMLANGYDACIEAGVTPRIDVTTSGMLASTAEVVFIDKGIGMTREIFENIFAAYGESTKRHTDAFTGGFGLGCKTPYTMSDTFTVITSRDGIKTLGMFTRDEDDFGNADFMDLGETDETGTTITIPLSRNNVRAMEQAVRRAAYAMPSDTVYLNGNRCPSIHDNSFALGDTIVINEYMEGMGNWNVLMGGILYPLDNINFLPETGRMRWGRPNATVVFVADVGDFKPTPQRDELQDIRSNRDKITERYNTFRSAAHAMLSQHLSENYSHFEAIAQCRNHGNWFSMVTSNSIVDVCNWNGKTLKGEIAIPNKTIHTKKYRSNLTTSSVVTVAGIKDGSVVAYVGMDASNLYDRKFVMDFNARAKANANDTVNFIFLDEGEVIEHEWLIVGGENSQVELVTRDVVYAVRPRATQRARQSAYTTTYTVRSYKSDGTFDARDLHVEDVPSDVQMVKMPNWTALTEMYPQFFAGRNILVLRSGQQEDVMKRRIPHITDVTEQVEAMFNTYVDEKFNEDVITMIVRSKVNHWNTPVETFSKVAQALPESRFAQVFNTYYSQRATRLVLPEDVQRLYSTFNNTPAVQNKVQTVEQMVRSTSLTNLYPLLNYANNASDDYIEHAKIYVTAVEQKKD